MPHSRTRIAIVTALFCAAVLAWLSIARVQPSAGARGLCSGAESFGCDVGGGSGFALRVVVRDPDGNPVAGAWCRWTQVQCSASGCAEQTRSGQTDAQGEWVTDHCVDCSRAWTVLVEKRWEFDAYSATFGAGAGANGGTCTLQVVLTRPATPTPTRPPQPSADPPSVYTRPPDVEVYYRPSHPLVVGQDPQRRGVDICLRAISYPVVRVTYTVEWDEAAARWVQVAHRELIPDPVNPDALFIRADLTEASARWITDVLALRYPGISIRQPRWDIAPGAGWQGSGRLQPGGTYLFQGCDERIPLADPGVYRVWASVSTRGTAWSAPLERTGAITLPVAFLGVSLVE